MLFKANNGRIRNPKAFHLSGMTKHHLTPKYFEEKLGEYLSMFDNDGQSPQTGPVYGGSHKYSDPQ